MPAYDYRCTRCGLEIEVSHGIHGSGPAACESCGGPMRKALSAPAIHFKGSGWAKKDAQAGGTSKAATSTTGADGDKSSQAPSAATSTGAESKKAAETTTATTERSSQSSKAG